MSLQQRLYAIALFQGLPLSGGQSKASNPWRA